MRPGGPSGRAAALAALLAFLAAEPARGSEDPQRTLERIEKRLDELRPRLAMLRDVTERGELPPLERARRRLGEAETQFLLENYEGCAALLLDAVGAEGFDADEAYPLAAWYLGESLFRTGALVEGRRHLLEAARRLPAGKQRQDAVMRLLEIAERTGAGDGLDERYAGLGAEPPPRAALVFRYARWTSRRPDLPWGERLARALRELSRIPEEDPYFARSLYLRGALTVESGQLEEAAALFDRILDVEMDEDDEQMDRLVDLATLALARIRHAQGRWDEAVLLYLDVPGNSPDYLEALFERADTFVRMSDPEGALRTADVLLSLGEGSPVLSQVRVFKAHLLLRLGRFEEATRAFEDVVRHYSPVRDQINALLDRPDAVAYFDSLLARKEQGFDLVRLLPAEARPYVDTEREVEIARRTAAELAATQQEIEESQKLGSELVDSLAEGRLDLFPELLEVNGNAIQESNALAELEAQLVSLQARVLAPGAPEATQRELARLEQERRELDDKFRQLPKSQKELEERRSRYVRSISGQERRAAGVRRQLESLTAEVAALERLWLERRDRGGTSAEEDGELRSTLDQYRRLIGQLDEQRTSIEQEIARARATARGQAMGGSGEEEIRQRYRDQIGAMQAIVDAQAPGVGAGLRPLLARAQRAREEIARLQEELAGIRGALRTKAVEQADTLRQRIVAELGTLDEYQRQAAQVEPSTRELLGSVVFDSFSRVGRRFSNIVLEGDVGVIDVAWARKSERTNRIASLTKDKDEEVKRLQERFSEVLTDGD